MIKTNFGEHSTKKLLKEKKPIEDDQGEMVRRKKINKRHFKEQYYL